MSLKPRSKRRWRNTDQVPKFWSLQREAKLTRQKFQPRTAAPFSIPTWHFRIATPHGNGRLKDLVGAWENQLSPARNLSRLQSIHFFRFSAWVANNSLGKCHEEPGRRKTTVVTYLFLIFWIWQHTMGKTSCLACSRRDEMSCKTRACPGAKTSETHIFSQPRPAKHTFFYQIRHPKTSETRKPHKIKGPKTSETHIFFSETHKETRKLYIRIIRIGPTCSVRHTCQTITIPPSPWQFPH